MAIQSSRQLLNNAILEKDFRQTVVDIAQIRGWTIFSTWNSKHSPSGEPDLRMVRPPRVIFAELKTEKGRMTAAQDSTMALLALCPSVESFLWRPHHIQEIEAILE